MASAQPTGYYVSLILCCIFNQIHPLKVVSAMASDHIFLLSVAQGLQFGRKMSDLGKEAVQRSVDYDFGRPVSQNEFT